MIHISELARRVFVSFFGILLFSCKQVAVNQPVQITSAAQTITFDQDQNFQLQVLKDSTSKATIQVTKISSEDFKLNPSFDQKGGFIFLPLKMLKKTISPIYTIKFLSKDFSKPVKIRMGKELPSTSKEPILTFGYSAWDSEPKDIWGVGANGKITDSALYPYGLKPIPGGYEATLFMVSVIEADYKIFCKQHGGTYFGATCA